MREGQRLEGPQLRKTRLLATRPSVYHLAVLHRRSTLKAQLSPVILCIEDNASSLILRKMLLESSGYMVLGATSGQEALQLLQGFHVDLVLSDHYLRNELGAAVAANIKALQPNVPVLIISGSADSLQETEHVDGVISKADGPSNLLVSIARALRL